MAPSEVQPAAARAAGRRATRTQARARARRREIVTGGPPACAGARGPDSMAALAMTARRGRLIVDGKGGDGMADTRITVRNNGPYRVEGTDIVIVDQDGQ